MSLNKVMLIGNVGRDPRVKYTGPDMAVAEFSLATTEPGYTLKNGTQVAERTDWHRIVVWGRLAKLVEQYVKKGVKLFIEGSIHTRTYEAKDGSQGRVTEVWASKIEFCSVAPNSNVLNQ